MARTGGHSSKNFRRPGSPEILERRQETPMMPTTLFPLVGGEPR